MQDKNFHILFVITQGSWGGAQRYVFDLAQALARRHKVSVAIGEDGNQPDLQNKLKSLQPPVTVIQLKHLRRAVSPVHDCMALLELKKLYHQIKPDIVHLNSSKAGILGSGAAMLRRSDAQVIYTVHGWVFLEPISRIMKILYRWLEKLTAGWKDGLIVLSPEEEKITSQMLGIPQDKVHLIPLSINQPVSTLNRGEARKKIQTLASATAPTKFWVGTLAGLYRVKGLDVLVAAAKHLPKDILDQTIFFIIGDGPEKNNLKKQITLLGLQEKVLLLGHIENAAELLPAFDLFVLPSKKEGLPYALLEAQSVGLPIIATRVGGIPSLLRNSAEVTLISPNNIEELTQALVHRLHTSSYPQPRTSSGAPDNSGFTAMISRVESLYFSVLPH